MMGDQSHPFILVTHKFPKYVANDSRKNCTHCYIQHIKPCFQLGFLKQLAMGSSVTTVVAQGPTWLSWDFAQLAMHILDNF